MRGEEILLPLHPSRSPLTGEMAEDEAFFSREGWGGVFRIYARGLIYINPPPRLGRVRVHLFVP
jgi:hypothetical protein